MRISSFTSFPFAAHPSAPRFGETLSRTDTELNAIIYQHSSLGQLIQRLTSLQSGEYLLTGALAIGPLGEVDVAVAKRYDRPTGTYTPPNADEYPQGSFLLLNTGLMKAYILVPDNGERYRLHSFWDIHRGAVFEIPDDISQVTNTTFSRREMSQYCEELRTHGEVQSSQ